MNTALRRYFASQRNGTFDLVACVKEVVTLYCRCPNQREEKHGRHRTRDNRDMATTVQTERKWASPDDWARHKDVIIKLYSDDDMALKEVMQIMEEKHDFYAT